MVTLKVHWKLAKLEQEGARKHASGERGAHAQNTGPWGLICEHTCTHMCMYTHTEAPGTLEHVNVPDPGEVG